MYKCNSREIHYVSLQKLRVVWRLWEWGVSVHVPVLPPCRGRAPPGGGTTEKQCLEGLP